MIKQGDFIELELDGKLDNGLMINRKTEKAYTLVGKNWMIQGLDDSFVGKKIGEEYSVDLLPKEAFGDRNPKLTKLIPMSQFKKFNINPIPGLEVNVDGMVGRVQRASGGRVVVDFNHPFSGHKVNYKVKITKVIDDKKEIVQKYLEHYKIQSVELDDLEGDKIVFKADKKLISAAKPFLEKHMKDLGFNSVEVKEK